MGHLSAAPNKPVIQRESYQGVYIISILALPTDPLSYPCRSVLFRKMRSKNEENKRKKYNTPAPPSPLLYIYAKQPPPPSHI